MFALPADTSAEKAVQSIHGLYAGDNSFVLTSQNVRKVRIYLHPRMVDVAKPITVVVNKKKVVEKKLTPSLVTMLELIREFDDPGRIFHAFLDVEINTDQVPDEPRGQK